MDSKNDKKLRVLLTGAHGMLGRYLASVFSDAEIITLGLSKDNDITCDLSVTVPELNGTRFDLVIHAAGTRDESRAEAVNLLGTRRLLEALRQAPPAAFLFISTAEVYGRVDGEMLDESTNTWSSNEFGRSKILAEGEIGNAFAGTDTVVTILRPVWMFGAGLSGWQQQMFIDVVGGRYLHVRDNDAVMSAVTAYDVARAARALWRQGGVYNVSDGKPHRWIDLAEAMSANAGVSKRMPFLPAKWAALAGRLFGWIPGLGFISPAVLDRRSRSLTFSNEKIRGAVDFDFFDTVDVIARRDANFPYQDPD